MAENKIIRFDEVSFEYDNSKAKEDDFVKLIKKPWCLQNKKGEGKPASGWQASVL